MKHHNVIAALILVLGLLAYGYLFQRYEVIGTQFAAFKVDSVTGRITFITATEERPVDAWDRERALRAFQALDSGEYLRWCEESNADPQKSADCKVELRAQLIRCAEENDNPRESGLCKIGVVQRAMPRD